MVATQDYADNLFQFLDNPIPHTVDDFFIFDIESAACVCSSDLRFHSYITTFALFISVRFVSWVYSFSFDLWPVRLRVDL